MDNFQTNFNYIAISNLIETKQILVKRENGIVSNERERKNSSNVTFNRKLTGTDNEGEEENRNEYTRVRTSFSGTHVRGIRIRFNYRYSARV